MNEQSNMQEENYNSFQAHTKHNIGNDKCDDDDDNNNDNDNDKGPKEKLKLKVEFAAVFLQLFDGIPIKNFAV